MCVICCMDVSGVHLRWTVLAEWRRSRGTACSCAKWNVNWNNISLIYCDPLEYDRSFVKVDLCLWLADVMCVLCSQCRWLIVRMKLHVLSVMSPVAGDFLGFFRTVQIPRGVGKGSGRGCPLPKIGSPGVLPPGKFWDAIWCRLVHFGDKFTYFPPSWTKQ